MFGCQEVMAIGIAVAAATILLYRSIRSWSGSASTGGCGGCSGCATGGIGAGTASQKQLLTIEPQPHQRSCRSED